MQEREGRPRRSDVILNLVKPYAEMRMSSDEIEYAILYDAKGKEREHTRRSIGIALGQARRNGALPYLETEEQQDIQADHDSPKNNPQERVLKWLITREVLGESISLPQGRLEWKDTIKKLEEEGVIREIISATKPFISRKVPLIDAVQIYLQGQKKGAVSNEKKSFAFVVKCLKTGLIEEDPSDYIALHRLYSLHSRRLPESYAERLMLEVFLKARRTSDMVLLVKYRNLGEGIKPKWTGDALAEEEDFISTVINSGDEGGDGEDNQGLYRLGPDGERWRTPIGLDDNGQIVYETLTSRMTRRQVGGVNKQEPSKRNKTSYSSLA